MGMGITFYIVGRVTCNWGEPERAPPRDLQRLRCLSHNNMECLALWGEPE